MKKDLAQQVLFPREYFLDDYLSADPCCFRQWAERRCWVDVNITCNGKIPAELQHINVAQEQIAVNYGIARQNILAHILQVKVAFDYVTGFQHFAGTAAVDYYVTIHSVIDFCGLFNGSFANFHGDYADRFCDEFSCFWFAFNRQSRGCCQGCFGII